MSPKALFRTQNKDDRITILIIIIKSPALRMIGWFHRMQTLRSIIFIFSIRNRDRRFITQLIHIS